MIAAEEKNLFNSVVQPISIKNQLNALFLALLTVILFYLAFPSGGIAELAWITLVPVVIALYSSNQRNAFMLGLLAATLGWMCSIWWAVEGVAQITSSTENIVLPVIFFFCLLSALPYAVACWLHVRLKLGSSLYGAFASAVIFTVLANYIPHVLPGNLAHALYLKPSLIQLADVGGVALVFFIIHAVNILIANGITLLRTNKAQATQCFVMAFIIFLGNYSYGQYKIRYSANITTPAKSINIAIVQPNIDIKNRTREDWQQEQKKLKTILQRVDQEQNIDLAILPEVPVPISYQYYEEDKKFFTQNVYNTPLLLTAIQPITALDSTNASYFNTMEYINHNAVQQRYNKQVLLPFGEYLPFEQQLPWLRKVFPYAPNYIPGEQTESFIIQGESEAITAIPLICYEAVFPNMVAKGVAQGGEIIINSSNDAWFSDNSGQKVHLALSMFRSIEYRKYLVRATNTGISAVIDPYGRILSNSKIATNTVGYSVSEIQIQSLDSFYQQYPNVIKAIFFFISLITITRFRRTDAKN